MDWIYDKKPITKLPEKAFGFIYKLYLTDADGVKYSYIGKKACISTVTIPALKNGEIREGATRIHRNVMVDDDGKVIVSRKDKAAARKDGRKAKRTAFDEVMKESKWQNYEGSSEDVENYILVEKHILEFVPTKRSLTYAEVKWQFKETVLEDPYSLNRNINHLWFKGKLL